MGKTNKYGVKVGDYFAASWGYDASQSTYFQVVALCGQSSVRVREVKPEVVSLTVTGAFSCDRERRLDRSKLLPPVERSLFIKDQNKGDLKRLKSYMADGVSNPQFSMSSYADAFLCTGETDLEEYSMH